MTKQPATPPAAIPNGNKTGLSGEIAPNIPEREQPADAKATAPKPIQRAYLVVSLGHSDLWELQEIELNPNIPVAGYAGAFKVGRRGVPDTRQLSTARAIAGFEGLDPFDRGPSFG